MSLLIDLQPSAGPVLVVGGGTVATRKVRTLLDAAFEVIVVAPVIAAELSVQGVYAEGRPFRSDDITARPWALVLACTGDREVNRRVGELARAQNIPVLVADAQDESTFFSPAIHRDGDLQVAVSTGGADPSLALSIRERIIAAVGSGWGERLASAREAREHRLGRNGDEQ